MPSNAKQLGELLARFSQYREAGNVASASALVDGIVRQVEAVRQEDGMTPMTRTETNRLASNYRRLAMRRDHE